MKRTKNLDFSGIKNSYKTVPLLRMIHSFLTTYYDILKTLIIKSSNRAVVASAGEDSYLHLRNLRHQLITSTTSSSSLAGTGPRSQQHDRSTRRSRGSEH